MEVILKRDVKSKTLPEESLEYMALLIAEDAPKNARELNALIGDFLTDGMAYTEEDGLKLCQTLQKHFLDKKLISVEQRDTIIAEKLLKPVTINELVNEGHDGVIREDDFFDPLLAGERTATGNYNDTSDGRADWVNKKSKRADMVEQKNKDALDKKIDEFMSTKQKVPAPEVIHDKSGHSKADLYSPNITLIAGGKALLDKATLRLARGRKYGLVGRNGIGKTTLINAMCRREIEKLPPNLHIL